VKKSPGRSPRRDGMMQPSGKLARVHRAERCRRSASAAMHFVRNTGHGIPPHWCRGGTHCPQRVFAYICRAPRGWISIKAC
jgi:hypothetical protein